MKAIEKSLMASGIRNIAGVDEAGRGACAGPLLIAAVIFENPFALELGSVKDSKELSENRREELFEVICAQALAISIIEVSAREVDERGVHLANLDGMRRAILGLTVSPEYVLTDGYAIPGLTIPSLGIWKGDQVVGTIGAASIVAKVTRDRIMNQYSKAHPEYGFSSHKGYSTAGHMRAVKNFGVLDLHRRSFSNIAALINT